MEEQVSQLFFSNEFVFHPPSTGFIELLKPNKREYGRYGHRSIFNSSKLIVLGGLSDILNITNFQTLEYSFQKNRWENEREYVTKNSTSTFQRNLMNIFPLHGHTCTTTTNKDIYIFGGENCNEKVQNNLIIYDLKARKCKFLNQPLSLNYKLMKQEDNSFCPSPRKYHTTVFCKAPNIYKSDILIVFGGQFNHYSFFEELWIFKINSHSWERKKFKNRKKKVTKKVKKKNMKGKIRTEKKVKSKKRKIIVIHSASTPQLKASKRKEKVLLKFNSKKNSKAKKKIYIRKCFPSSRSNHSSCFDSNNQVMYIYGGVTENCHFLDDLFGYIVAKNEWILVSEYSKKEKNPQFHPGGRVCSELMMLPDGRLCLVGGKRNNFPGIGITRFNEYKFICFYHFGRMKWSYLNITNSVRKPIFLRNQNTGNNGIFDYRNEVDDIECNDVELKKKRNRELWFHSSNFMLEKNRSSCFEPIQIFHNSQNSMEKFCKIIVFGGRSSKCGMISAMYEISIPLFRGIPTFFNIQEKEEFHASGFNDVIIKVL